MVEKSVLDASGPMPILSLVPSDDIARTCLNPPPDFSPSQACMRPSEYNLRCLRFPNTSTILNSRKKVPFTNPSDSSLSPLISKPEIFSTGGSWTTCALRRFPSNSKSPIADTVAVQGVWSGPMNVSCGIASMKRSGVSTSTVTVETSPDFAISEGTRGLHEGPPA